MIRTRVAGAVLLTTILLLGACGGSTPSEETDGGKAEKVSQAEIDKDAASKNIDKYFDLIGQDTEASYKEAAELAAPDSVAAAYATHLGYASVADIADGYESVPQKYAKSDKGFKICDLNNDGDNSDCSYYSDFETTAGKVASFSADGTSLDGRITLGSGDTVKAGNFASVKFLSAYQSPFSDNLNIAVEVKSNDESIETGVGSADYRRPDGRQVAASANSGDYQVGPDSLVNNVMVFPGSEIGGEVSFTVDDSNYSQTQTVKFKTK